MDDDKDKYLLHWHTKPCLSYPTFLPSSILQWLLFGFSAVSCPFTPLCFFISYFYGWNGFPSLLYLVKKLKVLVTQSCLPLCLLGQRHGLRGPLGRAQYTATGSHVLWTTLPRTGRKPRTEDLYLMFFISGCV